MNYDQNSSLSNKQNIFDRTKEQSRKCFKWAAVMCRKWALTQLKLFCVTEIKGRKKETKVKVLETNHFYCSCPLHPCWPQPFNVHSTFKVYLMHSKSTNGICSRQTLEIYSCACIHNHVCRTHRSCWRQAWVVLITAAKKFLAFCLPFSSVTRDVTLTVSLCGSVWTQMPKPKPVITDTADESVWTLC